MKARSIFLSLIAALAVLVGCEKESATFLDEIQVSTSYLSFPAEGGPVDMKVSAQQAWSVVDLPEWISVSAESGAKGESTIQFTATAAEATREASFKIQCGSAAQTVNVIQMTEAVEPTILSVAEAVALCQAIARGEAAEQTIYVKGIVCKIDEISTSYGNATYYLSDDGTKKGSYGADGSGDGNWFEVYRGYWLNAAKFTSGDEFAVGDILVVKGVAISYKGTPETNQGTAEVISIEKSLIGIAGTELLGAEEGEGVTGFPLEGGSIKVTVNTKGNGFHVVIPAEAKSWLHIEDFGADYVTLSADANTGGERSVSVQFTTDADGTTYSCEQGFVQEGAILEVSVADFLAAEVGDALYRITGVVMENYASDKNGESFYIQDWSGKTLVYRVDSYKASGAKVGDVVTVVGKRGEYKENPQLVSGTFEELKYAVTEVSIAEFLAKPDDSKTYYMVTGTVKDLLDSNGKEGDYGNLHLTDGTNELYVYGCYPGYGATGDARKGLVKAKGIKAGDKLTVIGPKSTYKDVPQVNGGIYFSHESAE